MGKFRRLWAWIEHAEVAHSIGAMVVSAVSGAGVGYWTWWQWATQYGYVPVYIAALATFALTIWLINGIVWWSRQRRPSRARLAFDYTFALPVVAIRPSLDLKNKENTLEIRLTLRNVAPRALHARIERMRVEIEDRFREYPVMEFTISKGIERVIIPNIGFEREAYEKFGERTHGQLTCEIIYGHPNDDFARRTTKIFALNCFKMKTKDGKPDFVINWFDRGETDETF